MRKKQTSAALPPAGWYPNPATGQQGYWDGVAWTTAPTQQGDVAEAVEAVDATDGAVLASSPRTGLIPSQEIVDIDVPAHRSRDLQAHIMQALSEKPSHRIVTMTMATYGESPLFYRLLVVIEYL
ncbi:MAG: DUF2510 domain-containing protein [Actinobacteria bacterium]|nr:DUF2510 domain-containing protein [Actinomycetota bacterium]